MTKGKGFNPVLCFHRPFSGNSLPGAVGDMHCSSSLSVSGIYVSYCECTRKSDRVIYYFESSISSGVYIFLNFSSKSEIGLWTWEIGVKGINLS